MDATNTPREIDEQLAALYYEGQKLESRREEAYVTAKHMAGAQYFYRGRQRVTNMDAAEAVAWLEDHRDERNLSYSRTGAEQLAKIDEAVKAWIANANKIRALNELYTGWSRFFLVTSSNGHIHASMNCSTCRWTTTYGWLPELSGKSQAEAIAHFGPAAECLCSVCFPDAPVARMDGNLTKAQTEDLLAGRTPQAVAQKVYCAGSGQQAIEPTRTGYAAGNYGTCPSCGQHITLPTNGGFRIRKHVAK